MFLRAAQTANGSWPSLQELGLYLTSCKCCNKQPYFTTSPAGVLNDVPPEVKTALEALQQKRILPALKQVHDRCCVAKLNGACYMLLYAPVLDIGV